MYAPKGEAKQKGVSFTGRVAGSDRQEVEGVLNAPSAAEVSRFVRTMNQPNATK